MTWKLTTRGNSERCYLQVGFGFCYGVVDGRKHLPLVPKAACSNPYLCFKPIPNLNHSELMPNLKNLELMPKLNPNLKNVELMHKLNASKIWNNF